MITTLLFILVLLLVLGLIHYAASLFFTHPFLTIVDIILALVAILYILRAFNIALPQ